MSAFDQAWALLKMPMYHGTRPENLESILREGIRPTDHSPIYHDFSEEEIRDAMRLSGIPEEEIEERFMREVGTMDDKFAFLYPNIDDARTWADGGPVLEIDDRHEDMPELMGEPFYPQPEGSPYLDEERYGRSEMDNLQLGFDSHMGQMKTRGVIPPHLIRVVEQ
tara:strand:- start:1538 stop:2035 length:498 start_codon:yes stop_codon:yes gene_type:complete